MDTRKSHGHMKDKMMAAENINWRGNLYLQNRNFVIELPVHWWLKEMAVLVKIRYKCFLDATLNLLGLQPAKYKHHSIVGRQG